MGQEYKIIMDQVIQFCMPASVLKVWIALFFMDYINREILLIVAS